MEWVFRTIRGISSNFRRSNGNNTSMIVDEGAGNLIQNGAVPEAGGGNADGKEQEIGGANGVLEDSGGSFNVEKGKIKGQDPRKPENKPIIASKHEPQRQMNLEGVITLLDASMSVGNIDRQYEFSTKDVDPSLTWSTRVTFDAEFDYETGTWHAKNIKRSIDIEVKEIRKRGCFKTLDYKVQEILPDCVLLGPGGTAPASKNIIRLKKADLPQGGSVIKGDWLRLRLEADGPFSTGEHTSAQILDVSWIDMVINKKGRIKKNGDSFCIDSTVLVCNGVFEGGRTPRLEDRVYYTAVASDQGLIRESTGDHQPPYFAFKKRALTLSYDHPNPVRVEDPDKDWVDDDVLDPREEKLKVLVQNKCAIRIEPNHTLLFENLKIGETLSKEVVINNCGFTDVILEKVIFTNLPDMCSFEMESQDGKPVTDLTVVAPDCPVRLKIKCTSRGVGRTKHLMVFNFGSFQIARWLSVKALSPDAKEMEANVFRNSDVTLKNRNQLRNEILDDMINNSSIYEGATPPPLLLVRPPFFIPHRIGRYKITADLKKSFQEELNRCDLALTTIEEELNPRNYVERFQVSLWFEELQNEIDRREFDLKNAVLIKNDDDSFLLDVPRLVEFHPHEGDLIRVLLKRRMTDQEWPKVLVKFSEQFNRTYKGGPVEVQFLLGRTPYRRMHFGVQQAMEWLGPEWLFPEALVLSKTRICFIEDEEDNLHPKLTNLEPEPHPRQVRTSAPQSGANRLEDRRARSLSKVQGNVQVPSGLEEFQLKWFNHKLNEEQRNAVRRILNGQARPLPYIIFGPPGTGKTVTVVEAIMQIYFMEKTSRILVAVPSNAAADLIAERLVITNRFKPGDFIRLNGFIRSQNSSPSDSIADFCQDGEHLDSVVMNRLVICTVATAGQFFALNINTGHFSHVFVDEAGYCMEPETMIPCVLAAIDKQSQVILAGDPEQLGPVLMCSIEATRNVLKVSFLERLMKNKIYSRDEEAFPQTKYNPAVLTKLVRSYRAHPALLRLPSQMFYSDELVPCAKPQDVYDLSESLPFLPKRGVPLVVHGVRGDQRKDPGCTSWFNFQEISEVVGYVKLLQGSGISSEDIGIISPYRKQVDKIRQALASNLKPNETEMPKVACVEEFQGGERKVIIISTVRSYADKNVSKQLARLDFLYSEKRFNVAVTRAKALLIVVGNPGVLHNSPHWGKLLEYSIELGVYKGCNPPGSLDPGLNRVIESFNASLELASVSNDFDDLEDESDEESGWGRPTFTHRF